MERPRAGLRRPAAGVARAALAVPQQPPAPVEPPVAPPVDRPQERVLAVLSAAARSSIGGRAAGSTEPETAALYRFRGWARAADRAASAAVQPASYRFRALVPGHPLMRAALPRPSARACAGRLAALAMLVARCQFRGSEPLPAAHQPRIPAEQKALQAAAPASCHSRILALNSPLIVELERRFRMA